MRSRPSLALAPLLLLLFTPACSVYFGDDDGDDDCVYPLEASDEAFALSLRNPETGACEAYGGGGGGGGGCWDEDRPAGAPEPVPDWGQCFSECENLSETDCWAAERCRAVYLIDDCAVDESDQFCDPLPSRFLGCWAIAPSGPAYERVACESLDAYECSRHNDCVGNYVSDSGILDQATYDFVSCGPEPGAGGCALLDCAPGYHCEETCYPCDTPNGESCPPFCEAVCVPDVNECPIVCPPDSVCLQVCPDCMPGDSDCEGVCRWECVPVEEPPGCEAIQDEMTCIAAGPMCRPLYNGTCWMNPDGTWECVDTEFVGCQSAAP